MEQPMGDLSIKNVPEKQIAVLRARAAQNHRSLQGELRAIIDQVTRPSRPKRSVDEIVAEIRALGFTTPDESTKWIREDRDR